MNLYLLHNKPDQLLAYDKIFYLMDKLGNVIFRNERGQYHRDNDKPAVIWADGSQAWWVNAQIHRDNGLPAVIWANGYKAWYVNGKLHRDNDLPARVWANGYRDWWVNGIRIK